MKRALIIGGGPAGLMAAEILSAAGLQVTVCEAKPSVGRKFLMAGKSGLNLTKDEPFDAFLSHFGDRTDFLAPALRDFDANGVQRWARGLGQDVFTGSSGRVFPKTMKASPLLRAWLRRLETAGVVLNTRMRWNGWQGKDAVFESAGGVDRIAADVTILALGGASWARLGSDGKWAELLAKEGVPLSAFAPSNVGLAMNWTPHMAPYFGKALKAVRWQAGQQVSRGEAVLTTRGLEGGGIYSMSPALRTGASLHVDLTPDLSIEALAGRIPSHKPRLTNWLKNRLRFSPVKTALFLEMAREVSGDPDTWPERVKKLPVRHAGFLPGDEAISTTGGVHPDGLTPDLMLKARPGVFCAGEMIDWDAPTGGYLITACFATGRKAAQGALTYLAAAA